MSVDEVRPGMVGIGRTVFDGDRIEEFKVHLLGVLRNTNGVKRDLILARLEGGPLANTGVIAGMSGSPVYVDGRLLGAVSYSIGQAPKEPLAGITPIDEMVDATLTATDRRPPLPAGVKLEPPFTQDDVTAALRSVFATFQRPFAERPSDVLVLAGGGADAERNAQWGALLRPIATPLVMAGFPGRFRDDLGQAFAASGFVAAPGQAAPPANGQASAAVARARLRPGDPVGVNLIAGDYLMGATGTVTEVDGDTVYAFGHPFYNMGPTQFPMTTAYVHAILPSVTSSMKIASTGDTIGTFRQDRSTAIAGTLGRGPGMTPVRIALTNERGQRKTFAFEVVHDQLLTPLLTYMAILSTFSSYERENGTATFQVKGKATIRGRGDVTFEDIFAGEPPSVAAAAYVLAPMTYLMGNSFEPVEFESVDLDIASSERPLTATLERVWLDTTRVKAGTTVPLKILWRTYRGEEVTRTLPIEIPANLTGSFSIVVADGNKLVQYEPKDTKTGAQTRGLAQMLRALNKVKKNNRLYVRLLRQDSGAVINGESLTSLPPSVLAILEADRTGGTYSPLRNSTVGEWEVPTGSAVSGSRLLTLTLTPQGN
jgi:hypothetical protein